MEGDDGGDVLPGQIAVDAESDGAEEGEAVAVGALLGGLGWVCEGMMV